MYAIAFDLKYHQTRANHPKGVTQAYRDIAYVLGTYGFRPVQGSVYITDKDDLANLLQAILALKALPWFPDSVGDIRGFRVESWSDFTAIVKSSQ